jgi:hypothetical protein
MITITNECVDCKSGGLHCLGTSCPNRRVVRYFCDKCRDERITYHFDGKELCINCIEEMLEEVTEE